MGSVPLVQGDKILQRVALFASPLPGTPQLWSLANPLDDALWTDSALNPALRPGPLGNQAFDAREHQAYRGHTPGEHRWNCN
jgi:hypothetical protein